MMHSAHSRAFARSPGGIYVPSRPGGGGGPAPWDPSQATTTYWQPMNKTSGSGAGLTLLDQSGNAYNATVGGGTPSIVPNGIGTNPVLRLNGLTDYMAIGTSNALLPFGNPGTVALMLKGTLLSAGFGVSLALKSISNGYQAFFSANSAGYQPWNFGGGTGGAQTALGISGFDYSSAFFGFVFSYTGGDFNNAANVAAYKNNVLQTAIASSGAGTASALNLIGAWPDALGSLNFPGDIAEIIVFPVAADATLLTNIHTYFNGKYGVGVSALGGDRAQTEAPRKFYILNPLYRGTRRKVLRRALFAGASIAAAAGALAYYLC